MQLGQGYILDGAYLDETTQRDNGILKVACISITSILALLFLFFFYSKLTFLLFLFFCLSYH